MTRYTPAQHYTWFGITAVVLAAAFTWVGVSYHSPLVFAPSVFAALTAALLFLMAFRPAIETHEGYLAIGKRIIPWMDIRRLDRTGWISHPV
jgi:hypothetical protein